MKRLSRPYLIAIISILCLLIVAGCSTTKNDDGIQSVDNAKSTATSQVIEHDLGQTELANTPERIVVLEQGFTETVAKLGVKPIGVADDGKPERINANTLKLIDGYTSVGKRSEPNLEVIRTLKPDLIIADYNRHKDLYKQLSDIAPTIVLKNEDANYEETLATTRTIGKALNKEIEVDSWIKELEAQIASFKQEINIPSQTVVQIGYAGDNIFNVWTSSYFNPSFLTLVGFNYALKDDKEIQYNMTLEQLISLNPDVFFIVLNEDQTSLIEEFKDNKLWNSLQAVQNNQLYELSLSDWSRRRSLLAVADVLDDLTTIVPAISSK